MKKNLFMIVLWPGFLGALVLEMLVFALIDPFEVHVRWLGSSPAPMVLYTTAFFVFWVGTTIASVMTALLSGKSAEAG